MTTGDTFFASTVNGNGGLPWPWFVPAGCQYAYHPAEQPL